MKKYIALAFIIITGSLDAAAQSYHFSQFYSTPLLLNPAFTGYIDGPYRLSANFRSQWAGGGSPYFTGSLSGDISTFRNKLSDGHKAGIGLSLMNDQSLNGGLQTNSVGVSAAYHVGLDVENQHSVGVGLQGSYHNRRIDYTKLTFENQFGGGGFNASAPVGEGLPVSSKSYFDVNAGLLYNIQLEDKAFFGGISAYNVLQHKENLQGDEFRMPARFTLQTGGQFDIAYSSRLYYSITHMNQALAAETTLGAAYGLGLSEKDNNELSLGLWYRVNDALLPYLGYEMNSFRVGLSYDYTVSSLRTKSTTRNGFELSFTYKATDQSELKRLIPWY